MLLGHQQEEMQVGHKTNVRRVNRKIGDLNLALNTNVHEWVYYVKYVIMMNKGEGIWE